MSGERLRCRDDIVFAVCLGSFNDAAWPAFNQEDRRIGRDVFHTGDRSRGPDQFELFDGGAFTQAKLKRSFVTGHVSITGDELFAEAGSLCDDVDGAADSVTCCRRGAEADIDEMS